MPFRMYIIVRQVFQLEHFAEQNGPQDAAVPWPVSPPERFVSLLQREDDQRSSQVGLVGKGVGQADRAQSLRPFG
jgi:hypothetical protein